jgi:hypothetical protein
VLAIAAVLLQDARAGGLQQRRKLGAECGGIAVEAGVGAPAEMLGAVEDFLDAHLEDHVGMSADPGAARRNLAQQRVERGAGLAAAQRIDPDEDAIHGEQLRPHFVGKILVVDGGFGSDTECRQLLEDAVKTVVLRCRGLPRRAVAAPENGNAIGLGVGCVHGHAPRLARGAELGREPPDGVSATTPLRS